MKMEMEQIEDIKQEIREKFPEVKFPEVSLQPLQYGRRKVTQIEDKKAVVVEMPKQDPIVAAICSDLYALTPFELTVKKMLEGAEKMRGTLGDYKPQIEIIDNVRMKAGAKFDEKEKSRAEVGEDISTLCGFRTSYDMSWEHSPFFDAIRLVCSNGMVAHKIEQFMSHRHVQSLDLDKQVDALVTGSEMMEEQRKQWREWKNTNIRQVEAVEILEALPFGNKHREEILALPEVGTGETLQQWMDKDQVNLWRMYNINTQFLSHEVESDMVRIEKTRKVAKVFDKMAA